MRCRSSPTSAPRYPGALIDWVVEPGVRAAARARRRHRRGDRAARCGAGRRQGWWRASTRARDARLRSRACGASATTRCRPAGPHQVGADRPPGARPELRPGQSHRRREPRGPARWLVTHAIRVEPHSHALDRSRELVARGARHARRRAAVVRADAARVAGRRRPRTVVLIHGTSRADKLWPEASWIELGRRLVAAGWAVALPQASAEEAGARRAHRRGDRRRQRRSGRRSTSARFIDRLAASGGAIGVDSGPSHIAVALGLPHVQIYNFPTAWRTGPQARHGARPPGLGRRRADARRRRGVGGVEGRAERRPRRRGALGAEAAVSGAAGRRAARAAYSLLLRLVAPLYLLRVLWRGRREPLYAQRDRRALRPLSRSRRRRARSGSTRSRSARRAPPRR